jgi:hypothetical protein
VSFDHESFWVVVGTAAPVIALAAVVAATDTVRFSDGWTRPARAADEEEWPEEWLRRWRSLSISLWGMSGVLLTVQVVALISALTALYQNSDPVPGLIPLLAEPTSIGLLFIMGGVAGDMKALRRRAEKALDKRFHETKAAQPSLRPTPKRADPTPHEDGPL